LTRPISLANTTQTNLSGTYGSKAIIRYFGERTLAKLRNESDVHELKGNDRALELLNKTTNSGTAVDPKEIDFNSKDREQSEPILQIFSQFDVIGVEDDDDDDDDLQVLMSATQLFITHCDMQILKPTEWLNDTVISGEFRLIPTF
jgi:hypothetical protein